MFSRKSVFVPAALMITGFAGGSTANAQNTGCYTLASLQGSYAVIGNYGDSLAIAFGIRYLDAKGNMTAVFIANMPTAGSTTGARTLTTGTQVATYTVNCDGTGVITRMLTQPNGATSLGEDDFIITGATVQNGQLIATTIEDAQRIPSAIVPGGVFLRRTHTRLPDATNGCYTLASLQGSYAVANTYGANVALGLQPESLDGKGNLTRTGILNQPTAGSTTGQRTIGTVTSKGTYTVNCNGTGTITRIVTRPDGTTAPAVDDFLITQAMVKDGGLIATTIVDAQRDPSVILPGGVFLTRIHTLRPPQTGTGTSTPPSQPQTVAVAGPKNFTAVSRVIQLDGSQSTSADGKPLTYLWTIPQGSPLAAISGGTTATPTVQFAQARRGPYTFQLTVTDSAGTSATDQVTVNYQGN